MYLLYNLVCLLEIGSIACVCTTSNAQSLNLLTCSLKSGSHVVVEHEVGECDVCAFRGELHCDSLSDAAGCPRDEGSLTC